MTKTFDSTWLKIRANDTELVLKITAEGGRRLQSLLLSSSLEEPGKRTTKWKVSEAFVLATLFGEFKENTAVSVAEAWIDLKDRELVHDILNELMWGDGKVVIGRQDSMEVC